MIQFKRFNPNDTIRPFDCGDADLNGFLLEEEPSVSNARHHTNELLAVTYLIEDEDKERTIAYFSLLNDKIEREITDNSAWNRLSREIRIIKDFERKFIVLNKFCIFLDILLILW